MTDFPVLQSLGYILFTAAVAVLLLRLARVPTIVAYMAAGIVLGPVAGVLTMTESVNLIADVGIALLLFLVGLELSLDKIRGIGRVALLGGSIQMVVCGAIGWGVARVSGASAGTAAVLALAVTFSSTVVVVKLLGHKRQLSELHGRIAVGILLVQDAAVAIALTLFAALQAPQSTGVGALVRGIGTALAGMLLLAGAAALGARWLLPRLLAWVRSSSETVFIWSLAWCFLFIVLAESVRLSVELGAFIAGIGLAQLHVAVELRRRVQPLVNFFLAVFFVSLGLHLDPASALSRWPLVLGLCLIAVVVKPAVLFLTVPRFGFDRRSAFLASISLAQMSEFSFILAALATAAGVLDSGMQSVITVAGLITIALSSYLIVSGESLYARMAGRRGRPDAVPGAAEAALDRLEHHVIVVGMNSLGVRIVEELVRRGEAVIAIDTDPTKLMRLPSRTLLGSVDDLTVLEEANFGSARLVVSALQIEDTNNLLAYRCHRAGVPVSIHAYDLGLIEELKELGTEYIMVPKHDGTRQLALRLRDAGVLD
ncbi:MAG TPA: cation:proton antiporter [Longimicrobiales bacterium]